MRARWNQRDFPKVHPSDICIQAVWGMICTMKIILRTLRFWGTHFENHYCRLYRLYNIRDLDFRMCSRLDPPYKLSHETVQLLPTTNKTHSNYTHILDIISGADRIFGPLCRACRRVLSLLSTRCTTAFYKSDTHRFPVELYINLLKPNDTYIYVVPQR